jgi:ADP-ribose pyrophosphatase YjhB (NUDIX family)
MNIRVTGLLLENNTLLLLRQDTDSGRTWSLPGGKVEERETLAAALQREMREETGLEVAVSKLVYVCDYFPEEHKHIVHMSFFVNRVGGALGDIILGVDTNRIHAVEMVPLDQISDKISPQFAALAAQGFPTGPNNSPYMGLKNNIGL